MKTKETSHFDDQIREDLLAEDHHIDSIYREVYKTSSNKHEKKIHEDMLAERNSVLRRGWPDLAVFNEDDFFVVEVKAMGDRLSPAQVVLLHKLAECGIDAYVAEEFRPGVYTYRAIGDSRPWVERGTQEEV